MQATIQVNHRQMISLSRAQRSDGRNTQIIGGSAWSRASALSNSGDPFKPIHCPIRQTTEVEVRDGAVRHVARKVDECYCATGEHVVGTTLWWMGLPRNPTPAAHHRLVHPQALS